MNGFYLCKNKISVSVLLLANVFRLFMVLSGCVEYAHNEELCTYIAFIFLLRFEGVVLRPYSGKMRPICPVWHA